MKPKNLFQVFDKELNSERFCFTAKTLEEAKEKFNGWLRRHGYLPIKELFSLIQVTSPEHPNNIHNEWV